MRLEPRGKTVDEMRKQRLSRDANRDDGNRWPLAEAVEGTTDGASSHLSIGAAQKIRRLSERRKPRGSALRRRPSRPHHVGGPFGPSLLSFVSFFRADAGQECSSGIRKHVEKTTHKTTPTRAKRIQSKSRKILENETIVKASRRESPLTTIF